MTPTRDDIIRLASECGFAMERHYEGYPMVANRVHEKDIEAFFHAAQKLEREATVKANLPVQQLLQDMLATLPYNTPDYWVERIRDAIRNRSK